MLEDYGDAPEQPGGEGGQGGAPADAPEQPGGEAPDAAPEPPDGTPSESLTSEDIAEGDTVTLTVNENGEASAVALFGSMGDMGGHTSGVDSYDAVNEYTQSTTFTGEMLSSTGTDENAVLVDNVDATATLDDVSITRNSDDSTGGDNSSFYGVGAAALVTDGTLRINNSTISTDAAGGAGVFAYGNGTAYVSDSSITTQQNAAGGIHVAGGGTYTSNGAGSPAVYSTADITVNDAALTANGSEAVCIEGMNTIRLFDCDLTGNMSDLAQNDCTWNVILYQSMLGDSNVGNSTFEMVGGKLTAQNGRMFYTTNTESTFVLSGVDITSAADSEFFLKCTGNSNQRSWGNTGANGADCHFTAIGQQMPSDVIWDSISQLDLHLLDGSTLTGAVLQDESAAGNGGDGYANLVIDKNSTWAVTGDSTLTNLSCAGTMVDKNGSTVTVQGTDGTVYVSGTGSHTVTVGSWSTTADTSGAATTDSWSSYEVARA